jgi:putative endonuclease
LELKKMGGHVYIMASKRNGVLYTGITSDLARRVHEHRTGTYAGFTREHHCTLLVWYEYNDDIELAITQEKRIKKWHRRWKLRLIEEHNPAWRDLYDELNA